MKEYNKYRFMNGKLISKQNGKIYNFRINEGDRFYSYIKQYIVIGKTTEVTKLMIDELIIHDEERVFLEEDRFLLKAILLATDYQNVISSFDIIIDNIKINYKNCSNSSYKDNYWLCSMFELEIPNNTKIEIPKKTE